MRGAVRLAVLAASATGLGERGSRSRAVTGRVLSVLALLSSPSPFAYAAAAAPPEDTPDRPHSQTCSCWAASLRAGAVTGPPPVGPGTVPWDTRNTDLAFWGRRAIQGRYDGFRVIDIRLPGNPRELAYFECVSPQGDVGVIATLSSARSTRLSEPTGAARRASPGTPRADVRAGALALHRLRGHPDLRHQRPRRHPAWSSRSRCDCGSHTHTVVPDRKRNRVLIYNSVSGNTLQPNPGKYGNRRPGPPFGREDIVEVPLSDPARRA